MSLLAIDTEEEDAIDSTEQEASNLDTQSDLASLVQDAAGGNESAREALVRRFLRPAYCVALSILSRPSDAEDVAQDAMIKALTKLDTCRTPEKFEAWLMQIVRNQARNWRKRRHLRDVSRFEPQDSVGSADSEQGEQATNRLAMQRQLAEALTKLSETQRAVVLLHDLEGYTHAEIADALDLSIVNSRQHLFTARRQLGAYLAKGDEA